MRVRAMLSPCLCRRAALPPRSISAEIYAAAATISSVFAASKRRRAALPPPCQEAPRNAWRHAAAAATPLRAGAAAMQTPRQNTPLLRADAKILQQTPAPPPPAACAPQTAYRSVARSAMPPFAYILSRVDMPADRRSILPFAVSAMPPRTPPPAQHFDGHDLRAVSARMMLFLYALRRLLAASRASAEHHDFASSFRRCRQFCRFFFDFYFAAAMLSPPPRHFHFSSPPPPFSPLAFARPPFLHFASRRQLRFQFLTVAAALRFASSRILIDARAHAPLDAASARRCCFALMFITLPPSFRQRRWRCACRAVFIRHEAPLLMRRAAFMRLCCRGLRAPFAR